MYSGYCGISTERFRARVCIAENSQRELNVLVDVVTRMRLRTGFRAYCTLLLLVLLDSKLLKKFAEWWNDEGHITVRTFLYITSMSSKSNYPYEARHVM